MNHSIVSIPHLLPDHIRQVFAAATCLYSKDEVEKAFDQMAAEISDQLIDSNPLFLCVVIGGIIPLGNLLPRLDFPLELDYIHATRYRGETHGGGLDYLMKPQSCLKDRTVVVVDDILDGGITLQKIVEYCKAEEVKAVYTVVLVDKKSGRLATGLPRADFCGLTIENNDYVFGYGMDYKGYLRNAPGIYMISSNQ